MSPSRAAQVEEYGWTATPCDASQLKLYVPPAPQLVDDLPCPDTAVAKASMEYAKAELPPHTFNHSMRVYYYGMYGPPLCDYYPPFLLIKLLGLAVARQYFPHWKFSDETWLLTCLFHDVGTCPKYTQDVFMSFDIHGGLVALDVLRQKGAPAPQAESVAEAVIRHQDTKRSGSIHAVGLLIQVITLFGKLRILTLEKLFIAKSTSSDNVGAYKDFVHPYTVEDVNRHYPRREWSKCFSGKLREEIGLKPWCHTTTAGESFPHDIEHNALMEPYDGRF
jgi:cyanamide hydratase